MEDFLELSTIKTYFFYANLDIPSIHNFTQEMLEKHQLISSKKYVPETLYVK
jgi:hypothetical protein